MSSNSLKLSFPFVFLIIFLKFASIEAQGPIYIYNICSGDTITANSTLQLNLKTLLSSLYSHAVTNAEFYNNTIMGINPSDTVYGLFLCRGDLSSQFCSQCVLNATQKLLMDTECSLSKEAVIWYDECMVRYNTTSFFSKLDLNINLYLWNTANISNSKSNQASFMKLLFNTMNKTADEAAKSPMKAAKSPMLVKKYATNQATISGFQNLYCLAQCVPNLSPQDCETCLSVAIGRLPSCCEGKQGGRVLFTSCNIRYEFYPFYYSIAQAPKQILQERIPGTITSLTDSKFSEDPHYLDHKCISNESFTSDSASSVKTLFSYLSSNASSGQIFKLADVAYTVYGIFMCRGDLTPLLCGKCVLNATSRIYSDCGLSKEAIVWFSHCLLHYSYQSFFYTMSTSPMFYELNITNTSNLTKQQNLFSTTVSNMLAQLKVDTKYTAERFKTESLKLNDNQTLYVLAQCTKDLFVDDCDNCLADIIGSAIPWCCLGSVGGRVLYPSCNLRFELFQFYRVGNKEQTHDPDNPPSPLRPITEKRKTRPPIVILVIVSVIISISLMLFAFCFYLRRRKVRRSHKNILIDNFGQESATVEQLQFGLAIIEAATNNFSHENRIGKGGFGEVYKGILNDGRQIAVKRLSKSSRQGAHEFKNEVLLIAKLQHRNLVTLIGFCLEDQEKILIYEYVPNKSLDYFLFDIDQHQKLLNWFERYNIIGGIAHGILYLHEHSRLKVIHRDLKPSNILLDGDMNPKISDFGLARIIEINQDEGSTNRIVGTYGYMSPEYAMLGKFSEKSDVFSFGVIVLEIITGRKIIKSRESHSVPDGLLNYVWTHWRDQIPLSILDPNIKETYSELEINRCIHIALLCVQQNPDARPTMGAIVSYLSSHLIELPSPQEPAFFLQGRMDPKRIGQESSSGSTPFSINEMSLSNFLPR